MPSVDAACGSRIRTRKFRHQIAPVSWKVVGVRHWRQFPPILLVPAQTLDPRVTERRNPRTVDIDLASAEAIVDLMSAEDRGVADLVATQRDAIARTISVVEQAFRADRRLLYIGAGTSGRLGVLDASECPPTFGTDPAMVVGLIAGGDVALRTPIEGAEDDPDAGADVMDANAVTAGDVVVGIAASGTTPFVRGALSRARALGATTALIACSEPPPAMRAVADIMILPVVGPEVLTGSTRLKAGTATKLVCNMITTGAMIRVGKSYGNLMVDLRATNSKLADRAERIVMEVSLVSREAARDLLTRAGGAVKLAIVMHALGIEAVEAAAHLAQAGGVIRRVIPHAPPPVNE
ncbi:MAG: N-acetylmuramic acid 6-phosphate etherase [Gemmatimonadaceae bacterium]|nr:N-acetylmuramic acid 6-phosphate etherase [Gemmatimonadaceae bacterium]